MALPRLTPSDSPYTVEITVNEKLRPYFEVWFQNAKEAGESPKQFALRQLKTNALNWHISQNIQTEQVTIEEAKLQMEQALRDDITSLAGEVD